MSTFVMNLRIKTRQILTFILFAFCIYSFIIVVFSFIYYKTQSIGLTPYAKPFTEKVDFEKSVYFSIVSFHTIGFGDIHPVSTLGRRIVMVQSVISMFFTSLFSGFLVYFIIKRPNDIFTTRRLYIRFRNERYLLSIRIGNKGRTIIDLKSRFEAWTIENNTRVRAFRHEQELPDLERILYYDIDLDHLHHGKLKKSLLEASQKKIQLHMKFSFIGNDIKSGEQVAFAKYYDSDDLRFGTTFLNVYSWDEKGERKDFRWKNFEKIEPMEEKLVGLFGRTES
ncbi:MAG: potassium channel family protein [Bacteroidetes bacterium]|nr:potassium channel family protein [Bacteroidota bacterium]